MAQDILYTIDNQAKFLSWQLKLSPTNSTRPIDKHWEISNFDSSLVRNVMSSYTFALGQYHIAYIWKYICDKFGEY